MLTAAMRNGWASTITLVAICLLVCWFVLLVIPSVALSQSTSTRIEGVSEPPELTGEPKKVEKATDADRQLFEAIGHLKDADETKSSLPKLDEFITQHPGYSDAYFLRAMCKACILNSSDFASISNDVEAATSHPGQVYNKTDYYSLMGKIELAEANYAQAINDLEKAMTRDPDTANRMFNIEGVEPQKSSKFCIWNLADLDELVKRFPKDYRALLFRGLYYEFFTTFKEDYYPKAMQEFEKAALLNPNSPLPRYFIAQVYSKASFWTKKAWASDAGRDETTRNAVQAYTKAIQLDSKFLLGYEHRAGGYLSLKQYPQALKDYDKILALDPENATAYSDRGIAKLETSQYLSATFDFGEAIRRKNEGDTFLPNLYEYRGDANVKLGNYRDAITDYSKAIERRLANDIFLFSLKQIRALYPEYDGGSDETLCRKLNILFFPQFEYTVFAKQLMEENGKWQVSLLNELYEKRGDTYLKVGDYRRGVLDFGRIFKGIPNFADSTDRWRLLGRSADGEEYYLDVKSADFSREGVRLWIKTVGKKETQTIAYEMDCKMKRINNTSSITYDSRGKVMSSSEMGGEWQRIIPDTIGEQLYNGACSAIR
jgi:tetratricopeptide (TPR) repeat protein